MVKLRLVLYGHLLPGAFWERHRTDKMQSTVFEPVHNRGSVLTHHDLRMTLSVYFDDFNVAGPEASMTGEVLVVDPRRSRNGRSNTTWEVLGSRPRTV